MVTKALRVGTKVKIISSCIESVIGEEGEILNKRRSAFSPYRTDYLILIVFIDGRKKAISIWQSLEDLEVIKK